MRDERTDTRAGQAMIEAMIGVILILILVAGTVQFGLIACAHSVIDSRIRGDTGVTALSPPVISPDTPAYILTWTPGADGQRYTADDRAVYGGPDTLLRIADHSARASTAGDWDSFDSLERITGHDSSLRNLRHAPVPMGALGFVGMRYRLAVPVSAIIRELVYDRADIQVSETVWVPMSRDLY